MGLFFWTVIFVTLGMRSCENLKHGFFYFIWDLVVTATLWLSLLKLSARMCAIVGQFRGPHFTVQPMNSWVCFNWNLSLKKWSTSYQPHSLGLYCKLQSFKQYLVCNLQYRPQTCLLRYLFPVSHTVKVENIKTSLKIKS